LIGRNVDAGRILAGVTFSRPGNWTSWPPHEHARMLEEAYLYIDMPAPGWGLQLVYNDPSNPELVTVVREGDIVLMPQGYHPNVSAPGSSINFLWMMAANREGHDRQFGVVNVQPDDGVGRRARNGLNFTERGFGVRGAVGCSDRGHTAVSQLQPGDVDWEALFAGGVRWFHTGGIFAALSESTPQVAREAMEAARRHGGVVSYDLNYRPSLWKSIGGLPRAQEVNRQLAPLVDVMLGNEEDFTAALGFEVEGVDEDLSGL